MPQKIIGVCVTSIHVISVHQLLASIGNEAQARGYRLQIWAPFSDLYHKDMNDQAQKKIFDLIPYDELSGLILFSEQIKDDDVTAQIIAQANQHNIPIVSLKQSKEGCFSITYDSEKAIGHIIRHLIQMHHCKKINFMAGWPDNPISLRREAIYKEILTTYHIPIEEERIGYGNFWAVPAIEETERFLESSLPLPDAIVCANDAMAIAVCECLAEHGLRIPEDIIVTGLGGIQERDYHLPLLTTAVYDPIKSSTYILNALELTWSGMEPPSKEVKLPCQLQFSESCGCMCHNNQESKDRLVTLYKKRRREHAYRHATHELTSIINSDCNLDTLTKVFPDYIEEIGIHSMNFYIKSDFAAIADLTLNEENTSDFLLMNQVLSHENQIPLQPVSGNDIWKCNEPLYGETGHILSIPLNVENNFFGILSINYQSDVILHESLYELVVTLDNILDNIQNRFNLLLVNRQLNEVSEQTIQALAEIVEAKSEFTGLHVKRVSEYTRILAEALDYSPEEVDIIRIASMMHDIGKINIPAAILEKPARLTDEEFEVIKTHVTEGAKLLHNSPGQIMQTACRIALEHHEKWDGSGYLGKKGTEIALDSRIVALADVFDALVSKRPYKEAFSLQKAYDIITEDSGTHFDPDVVKAFHEHFDEFAAVKAQYKDS